MDKLARKPKIRLLENLAKGAPSLALSVALTPIAVPYALVGTFFCSFASPVDGYAADRVDSFWENSAILNLWGYGLCRLGEVIGEYKTANRAAELSKKI